MIRSEQGVNMIANVRPWRDCGNGRKRIVEILSICPQKCPSPGQSRSFFSEMRQAVKENPEDAAVCLAAVAALLGVPALMSITYLNGWWG